MRSPYDVIVKPYITEKTNEMVMDGKYTFVVNKKATKVEIKNAVEKLFKVKVIQVNTLQYDGKKKRMGVHQGYRASWKKAVVKIDMEPKEMSYLENGGSEVVAQRKYKTSIEEFGATN